MRLVINSMLTKSLVVVLAEHEAPTHLGPRATATHLADRAVRGRCGSRIVAADCGI